MFCDLTETASSPRSRKRFRASRVAAHLAEKPDDVCIVSIARTPQGSLGGSLSSFTAPQLASLAIREALERASCTPDMVQEVFLGHVLGANSGQAPAKQAALGAGISQSCPCTGVNKVCSSGLKATMLGVQSIQLKLNDIVVVGGMESMSNVPYYMPSARFGARLGDSSMVDGLIKDGLWDPYNNYHMGSAGEVCAKEENISREDQDSYAIESYRRAQAANTRGDFAHEIVNVSVPQRRGEPLIVCEDEEISKVKFDRMRTLRPAFATDGTITAANASTISDGASALVLMSSAKCRDLGITPLAIVRGYADAAKSPEQFPTAPALAIPIALKRAGLSLDELDERDFFEVNEAFSVVALANMKQLGLKHSHVNVFGGGVSIGHPLGCSGSRILVTLTNVLQRRNGRYGVAGICNGGGGASAMIIERC